MTRLIPLFTALMLAPLVHATDMPHMNGSMNMPDTGMNHDSMPPQQAAKSASAEGTIKKIDTSKGTLTIAHGPVAELHWPAMIMPFEASPELISQVKVGDEIHFEFILKEKAYRITSLAKR